MPKRTHAEVPGSPILRERLGKRLRKLRIAQKLSQSQLGGVHYDRQYVSGVEVGRIAPTLPALLQFSRALKVPISELLESTDPPNSRRS